MTTAIEQVLSARDCEVLELIAQGCKNRQIAQALEIEEATVRFHVGNILDKPEVKNRTGQCVTRLGEGGSKNDYKN